MMNNDVVKGIEIQAKVDAQKLEKVSEGLNKANEKLKEYVACQDNIRDILGVVLSDMSAAEAERLYGIDIPKGINQLDKNETILLVTSIYTLLSSFGHNSEKQKRFYFNLEKILGLPNRNNEFDLNCLSNVDSHSDRLVILRCIMEFLFLEEESFEFINRKSEYSWIYAFAPIKDIIGVCIKINEEYMTLGIEGIENKYCVLDIEKIDEEIVENEENVIDNNQERDYWEILPNIIYNYSNSGKIGEKTDIDRVTFLNKIGKYIGRISYDSVIEITKIAAGYMIFTNHAMYIPKNTLVAKDYYYIPYKKIIYSEIYTESGKKTGTRKISIPYLDENQKKNIVVVDDKLLIEEDMQSLLVEIGEINQYTADSDLYIDIWNDFSDDQWKTIITLLLYVLIKENYNPFFAYFLCYMVGLSDEWNDICDLILDDEIYYKRIEELYEEIPEISAFYVSGQLLTLAVEMLVVSNRIEKKAKGYMNSSIENYIKAFAIFDVDKQAFYSNLKNNEDFKFLYKVMFPAYFHFSYEARYSELIKIGFDEELDYIHKVKPQLVIPEDYHIYYDLNVEEYTNTFWKIDKNIVSVIEFDRAQDLKKFDITQEMLVQCYIDSPGSTIIETKSGNTSQGGTYVSVLRKIVSKESQSFIGRLIYKMKNKCIDIRIDVFEGRNAKEKVSDEDIINYANEIMFFIVSHN